MQDDIPTRLRTLATHLARIQSFSIDLTDYNLVINLIRESQYFIEWTAPEMDIDTAAELVDLQRTLSRWQFNWDKIWSDGTERMNVAQIADAWSERVQTMSGKLSFPIK